MKEHPMIFLDPFIQPIIDGLKTQTRRPVKPQPEIQEWFGKKFIAPKCPWSVRDHLWVRETWGWKSDYDGNVLLGENRKALYRATDSRTIWPNRWHPSIHMPRWASRITLEVIRIWVERVQDISEEDAVKEGFEADKSEIWWQGYREEPDCDYKLMHQVVLANEPPDWMIEPHKIVTTPEYTAKNLFKTCSWGWDSIYAKKGLGWDINPWVWATEFKRISSW